jgi:hypothetical protein
LGVLRTEFEKARAGGCRVALVGGEPGIGKTRLVTEFCRGEHEAGATVLFGRCAAETLVPYEPLVEALTFYVKEARIDGLRLALGSRGGELQRILPALHDRIPDVPQPVPGDPGGERARLFAAVGELLGNAASSAPVLLVLDDLHWADQATLRLLNDLVGSARSTPLMIVGTYRDVEVGRSDPLADTLVELRRAEETTQLSLVGLARDEVQRVVVDLAGEDAPRQLIRGLERETEGNPLFLNSLLRHLIETGNLRRPDGHWRTELRVSELGIPPDIDDVIERRIARLSDGAHGLLQLASVVGREFDLGLLDAIGMPTNDPALRLLEEAIALRLIAEVPGVVDRFVFTHALVHEAFYRQLTRTRRVRLHRQIALALEAEYEATHGARLPEIAHHFLRAAPGGELDKAVEYASRAAERAVEQLAYEEAAAHYRNALGVLEAQGELESARCRELMLALADAQRLAGDSPAAREAFLRVAEGARRHGDATQLARAARGATSWSHAYTLRAQADNEGAALIDEALASLGAADDPLKAILLAQLAFARYFVPTVANESGGGATVPARKALAIARRVEDREALAAALHAQMYAVAGLDPRAALEVASEMLSLAQYAGDWEGVLWARSWRVQHHLMLADAREVDKEMAAFARLADELQVPIYQWFYARWRSTRAFLDAHFDEAERLSFAAYEIGAGTQQVEAAALHLGGQLATIGHYQGRTADFAEPLKAAIDQYPAIPAWRCGLAHIYAILGRMSEARELFEICALDEFATITRNWDWLIAMKDLSRTCAYLADRPRAEILYGLLGPYADLVACSGWATVCAGPVADDLGVLATALGRWGSAEQHFELALERGRALEAPAFVARTQLEYGRMLMQAGQPVRAHNLLSAAHAFGQRVAIPWLIE